MKNHERSGLDAHQTASARRGSRRVADGNRERGNSSWKPCAGSWMMMRREASEESRGWRSSYESNEAAFGGKK